MRVITIRQPWAWAIIYSGKDVENRSRNIAGDYRGPVAIHAGLVGASPTDSAWLNAPLTDGPMRHADRLSVRGQIIGVVDLVGTHHWSDCLDGAFGCSPWALSDCWHIALANPRPIDPIPYKGALGLTTIADPVVLGRLRATL